MCLLKAPDNLAAQAVQPDATGQNTSTEHDPAPCGSDVDSLIEVAEKFDVSLCSVKRLPASAQRTLRTPPLTDRSRHLRRRYC